MIVLKLALHSQASSAQLEKQINRTSNHKQGWRGLLRLVSRRRYVRRQAENLDSMHSSPIVPTSSPHSTVARRCTSCEGACGFAVAMRPFHAAYPK